jgi:hypothetical protein
MAHGGAIFNRPSQGGGVGETSANGFDDLVIGRLTPAGTGAIAAQTGAKPLATLWAKSGDFVARQ